MLSPQTQPHMHTHLQTDTQLFSISYSHYVYLKDYSAVLFYALVRQLHASSVANFDIRQHLSELINSHVVTQCTAGVLSFFDVAFKDTKTSEISDTEVESNVFIPRDNVRIVLRVALFLKQYNLSMKCFCN